MGDFWTDPAFWAGVGISVLAYVVGGVMHILIDYVHGKRLLRTYWDATDAKIAGIEDQVAARIRRELPAAPVIPPFPEIPELDLSPIIAKFDELQMPDVGRSLDAFLRSESGLQWARELASLAAADFEAAFLKRGQDKKGITARTQQATIERTILDSIRFGDRRLDSLWAIADDDMKRQFVHRIALVINRAGFVLLPVGEQSMEISEQLALTGGGREQGPPLDWDR